MNLKRDDLMTERAPIWTPWVFMARTFKVLAFPIMTVLIGHLVLFNVEQAQEAMQAALDDGPISPAAWWFAAGYFVWSLSVWYTSRLLLCVRWVAPDAPWSDPIGLCVSSTFARRWVMWLPRVLAMVSSLPTVWVMWIRGQYWAALLWTAASAVLLLGLVFRRAVVRKLQPDLSSKDEGYTQRAQEQWARFDVIGVSSWCVLILLAAAPWLMVLSGWFGGQRPLTEVARLIGTPGLVLLGLASYNIVGSMALVYGPMRRGWGSWAVLPVLMLIGMSGFNDNHHIGKRGEITAPQIPPLSIPHDLNRWLAQRHEDGRDEAPIYLVAISGGASRSAYWGAYTLAWLDDMQRQQGRDFLANVYAMSGVSGGSLGAAALVSFMADARARTQLDSEYRLADQVGVMLTQDYMAPAAQALLYVDLIGQLSPRPLPGLDRSHALERSWEDDFDQTRQSGQSPSVHGGVNWFKEPIENLYLPGSEHCVSTTISRPAQRSCVGLLPRLILNAASAQTGSPVLQTALDLQHPLARHMRDARLGLDHMTLSEAVHNSARFPFLSPAGTVRSKDGTHAVDHWVDGGYFENSGTWALQVLLQRWAQLPQWEHNPQGWRDLLSRVRVIVLTNDPVRADSASWLPPDGVSVVGVSDASATPSSWMMEFIAPAKGLFAARTARAQSETFRLAQMLAQWRSQAKLPVEPVIYQLKMPQTSAETPSMNWFINRRSSCVLRSYVEGRDVCPQAGVSAMPTGWDQASGYQRYRAELTRLRLQLGPERAVPPPAVAPAPPLQPLPALRPIP